MAIIIGSNFSYNGFLFLDERQGLPKTESDLKNWNTSIPEGFEVYLPSDGEWYVFKSEYNDPNTGHFRKRNQSNQDEINNIKDKIDNLEINVDNLNNLQDVIYADTFNDLLQESTWIINGNNYAKVGIIVSVINDGDNNGIYRLNSSDYKLSTNWIKSIDYSNLILSGDNNNTESSDNNIYTAKRVDEKFTRRDQPETIEEDWNFNHINVETSNIKDLADHVFENVKTGMDNMLRNTSFAGEYDSAILSPNLSLNDRTELYSQSYEYWNGVGTWDVIPDTKSATGFSVLLKDNSNLSQTIEEKMISGESYVISFKSKGNITVNIDTQEFQSTSEDYQYNNYKFNYSGNESCTITFTGVGNVCEIKLERGTVATSWFPSNKDTDPVASLINDYGYLKTAFKFYNDNCASGLLLKEIIQAVKYVNGNPVGDPKAGFSGIYNNDNNIFIWAGGDFSSANKLMGKLEDNPNYLPTDEELQNVAKFAVTFGGDIFINAFGKFRGYYESRKNGQRIVITNTGILKIFNSSNQQVFQANWENGYLKFSSNYWPTQENRDDLDIGEIYIDNSVQSGAYTSDGILKVRK